jgi:uncharacterized membrane protein
VLLGVALATVLEAVAPSNFLLADITGLWLVLFAPIAVWYGCAVKAVAGKEAAVFVALGFALITDMLLLLGLNQVLPALAGDERPLTRVSITAVLAGGYVVLGAVLPTAEPGALERWRPGPREARIVGIAGALCLVLSIAGPIRLNNGFGASVSLVAYVCIAALLVALLVRENCSPGAAEVGIYCAALGLLLLASLRGWSITGHDIQKEYHFFEVALGGERWDVRAYSDPFNACLSVTLFPVAITKLTSISGVYVFKVVIPALFACAPVMIFRAVRNVAGQRIAVLSATFFVMFPTFLNDMTYMARQEVAFVILGAAVLIVTDERRRLRNRRFAFLTLVTGLAVAHYSTTYVVVIVLTGAVCADLLARCADWRRARKKGKRGTTSRRPKAARSVIAWWMLPIVAGVAVAWAGPLTQTGGQLKSTLSIALQEISGNTSGDSGSSASSYSIFGSNSESDQQRLADYAKDSAAQSAAARAKGRLLPQPVLNKYPTSYAKQPVLHLTSVGKVLSSAGIDVNGTNALVRNLAADLLQGLIVLGLLATWLRRRKKGFAPLRDQITLSLGALCMLGAITLVPQLSVDYSTLRAFQQGIFFFAPFMAVGLIWMLSWLRRWTIPAVCALVAVLVLDLSGVVPRVTGGYAAQLPLANSGEYYDIYYPTTEEQVGASWLESQIAAGGPKASSAQIQTDRYTYYRLQDVFTGNVVSNLYPSLLGTNEYTFLGAQTVNDGQATIFYNGDLVNYNYPTALLNRVYNEIYASNGVEIYQ